MWVFRGHRRRTGERTPSRGGEALQSMVAASRPRMGPTRANNTPPVLWAVSLVAWAFLGAARPRRNQVKIGAATDSATALWIRTGLISAAILAVTLLMASGRKGTSFPVSGLILGALVLIYGFISTRTIIGRHVYAVGGNRHAAELSGVRSKRVNFLVMMNMSILAALAGMMFVARSNASGPFDGVGWELDAIAAVFIGGAAVTGGVGTVIGSIVGGLVMAVLNNGMQLLGVGADLTQIIKGLVLLIAVAFDVYNKMQGRPSIIGLLMRNSKKAAAPVSDKAA